MSSSGKKSLDFDVRSISSSTTCASSSSKQGSGFREKLLGRKGAKKDERHGGDLFGKLEKRQEKDLYDQAGMFFGGSMGHVSRF